MSNSTKNLVVCDEIGMITFFDITYATPSVLWNQHFSGEIFTCACLTPEGGIFGTLFGKIFVLKNSTHTYTIDAHRGSVTSVTSKVRIFGVILVFKKINS